MKAQPFFVHFAALLIATLLTACGGGSQEAAPIPAPSQSPEYSDSTQLIRVTVGTIFVLAVPLNASTGTHVALTGELPATVVSSLGEEYQSSLTTPNLPGAPGTDKWKLKAEGPGTVAIDLGFYRPSNLPIPPFQTTRFNVEVVNK